MNSRLPTTTELTGAADALNHTITLSAERTKRAGGVPAPPPHSKAAPRLHAASSLCCARLTYRVHVFNRKRSPSAAIVRIFHAHQPRDRKMIILPANARRDLVQIQRPVRLITQRARLRASAADPPCSYKKM